MKAPKDWIPLLTALIGAIVVLGGYMVQKDLERRAEERKTRQDIYSRLIKNYTEKNTRLGLLPVQSPEYSKASPEVRRELEMKDAELSRIEGERTEVVALLCLYGTDEAIDAYVKFARANAKETGGDLGQLILELRQSIYGTHLKANDADLAIWNDPKYLEESSPAK